MLYKLMIESKEQNIDLGNGYTAELRYNVFNKYWYYNLTDSNGEYVITGFALRPNCAPTRTFSVPGLVLYDEEPTSKESYNPYYEIGGRLSLYLYES